MIHQHQHHGENVKCRGAEGKTAGGGRRQLLYRNRSVIGMGATGMCSAFDIQESGQPQYRSDKLFCGISALGRENTVHRRKTPCRPVRAGRETDSRHSFAAMPGTVEGL